MSAADPSLRAAKRELRAAVRARLATVDAARCRAAGSEAAARLLALPELEAVRGLLVFLSFGHEIDTAPLIDRWLESGRGLLIPRFRRVGEPLEVCRFPCPLETSSFGIRQPAVSVASLGPDELASALDAVVVPGLAFDLEGRRLGHGAGAYDGFLSAREVPTIGFAHELQIVDRVPVERHDVRVGWIVTEARADRAGQGSPGGSRPIREASSA